MAPSNRTSHARWPTTLTLLLLLVAFCVGLLVINATAENVPGRRVTNVLVSTTPGAPFRPVTLPHGECCATTPVIFRTTLDEQTAHARDPAVLVVSAHDNARLYVNGVLTGGEGPSTGDPTNWSRRPRLIRIPATMAALGAVLDIEVQRGVGFGHLRPIYLGDYDTLYPSYVALRVLRADMPVATGSLAVFVAAFCLAAASLLGVRGLMYALGGLAASWALQVIGMATSDPPWNATVANGIYFTGYFGTSIFLLWFFIEWTSAFSQRNDPPHRLAWLTAPWPPAARRTLGLAALCAMLIGPLVIAVALSQNAAIGSQNIDRACGFLGLAVIAFCLVRVFSYYRRNGFRDPFEASAFIFVLISAVADIIMVRFFAVYGVSLGAAVMFFPLALLLSLAARARGVFEAATATAEKLNALVGERERVIVANMEEIRRNERAAMLLEERSRIMRDMHDGIGGQLLGLILQARARMPSDEPLVSGLEQSLDDLRLVVDSLEQGEGSLTGAMGAFRARIEPRCAAAGVDLDWRIEDVGATPNIGPDKTLQIYRVLLEACTNALKHGQPKRIAVVLRREGENIVIALADDGRGFSTEAASTGRGLANMRTRAQRIGAVLAIASDTNGTRISLKLAA